MYYIWDAFEIYKWDFLGHGHMGIEFSWKVIGELTMKMITVTWMYIELVLYHCWCLSSCRVFHVILMCFMHKLKIFLTFYPFRALLHLSKLWLKTSTPSACTLSWVTGMNLLQCMFHECWVIDGSCFYSACNITFLVTKPRISILFLLVNVEDSFFSLSNSMTFYIWGNGFPRNYRNFEEFFFLTWCIFRENKCACSYCSRQPGM